MPEATSTTRSVAMIKDLIARISKIPETRVVGGLACFKIVSFSTKANAENIFVNLNSWDDREGEGHHAQDVMNKIRAATVDIKEARILVIAPPAVPGLGATSGFTFELLQTTSTDDVNFFFQAEDGIRALTVTGVQTCALPILTNEPIDDVQTAIVTAGGFLAGKRSAKAAASALHRILGDATARKRAPDAVHGVVGVLAGRSEERRVGKECRSRWSRYH